MSKSNWFEINSDMTQRKKNIIKFLPIICEKNFRGHFLDLLHPFFVDCREKWLKPIIARFSAVICQQ